MGILQTLSADSSPLAWSATLVEVPASAVPPRIVGRYALFDKIASGGMGTIQLGRLLGSAGFERVVAVKRVHPSLTADAESAQMFRDEIQILSRIQHPNVVSAQDVLEDGDELLLVMEYVHGLPLSSISHLALEHGGPIPVEIGVAIACSVLDGLHAAHSATTSSGVPLEIVHRDVSPQNILVGCDGTARILDFGVAKATSSVSVTRVGHVKGKLGYVAPEHLLGQAIDARTDVYGVAVVLWELLAQTRLFTGSTDASKVAEVLAGKIPAFAGRVTAAIPRGLEALIRRGLASEPEARFASAREMSAALRTAVTCAPPEVVAEWLNQLGHKELAARSTHLARAENCPVCWSPDSATWPVRDRDSFSDLTIREARCGHDELPTPGVGSAPLASALATVPIGQSPSQTAFSLRPKRSLARSMVVAGLGVCAIGLVASIPHWGLGDIAHATSAAPLSPSVASGSPTRLEAKATADSASTDAPLASGLPRSEPRRSPASDPAKPTHAAPGAKPVTHAPSRRNVEFIAPVKQPQRSFASDSKPPRLSRRNRPISVIDGF